LQRTNLKSLSKDGIFQFIKSRGLPGYRAAQFIHWIYKKNASDVNDITEFSKELRNALNDVAFISNLNLLERLKSKDGTEKYLFGLEDRETIESVLIPEENRNTLCISSQVGCAMGCRFCMTARCGFIRNLKSYEIVDQIISVNRIISPEKVTNIVFMGMGEPLANFEQVDEALRRIITFIGISKRRITLSTSGIVPGIKLLAEKDPEINLAISLNATTDKLRDQVMPINRKYPISTLMDACRRYPLKPGRRITFEYIMMNDLNDSRADAARLVKLLKGIRCKVNLIPLNPFHGSDLSRPPDERILDFQQVLLENRIRAFIRESRGQDILAACGQLRAGYSSL
jgi:23S rRNA (adenine2503-C2)-methyltransferase